MFAIPRSSWNVATGLAVTLIVTQGFAISPSFATSGDDDPHVAIPTSGAFNLTHLPYEGGTAKVALVAQEHVLLTMEVQWHGGRVGGNYMTDRLDIIGPYVRYSTGVVDYVPWEAEAHAADYDIHVEPDLRAVAFDCGFCGGSASGETTQKSFILAPGQEVMVIFSSTAFGTGSYFAVDWQANDTASMEGPVVRTGGVVVMDMVQEARRRGTNVAVLGWNAVGEYGEPVATVDVTDGAFASINVVNRQADPITVRVSGATSLGEGVASGGFGFFFADFGRNGPLTLTVTIEGWNPGNEPFEGEPLEAYVVVADILDPPEFYWQWTY
ncbi:MAG: hypothetical protein HY556_09345 [Euryarchaeota archaeon]|nr:hypothetical protein [Euryarchaeota archaeon]